MFTSANSANTAILQKEGDYDTSRVLAVIKKEYSAKGREYKITDFSSTLIKSVTPLLYLNDELKENNSFNLKTFKDIIALDLKEPSKENVEKLIKELSIHPMIESAGKNYYIYSESSFTIPNDTHFTQQYALELIDAKRVWGFTKGNTNIKVGILDTGIYAHTDIGSHYNSSLSRNFTDDGKGLTDEVGHGTSIAGIIGALTNNSKGISGILWDTTLVSLKVLKKSADDPNNGIGNLDWTISAIQHAGANNIDILNASFSSPTYSQEMYNAISSYDGLIIAAAGNYSSSSYRYPAAYTCNNIISVAASTSTDTLASYSNFGSYVDLAAPSHQIYVTEPNNFYNKKDGTSMAAPHVTAVAALIASLGTNYTSSQIKNFILSNVDQITALSSSVATGGRLNAFKAVLDASNLVMGDLDFDFRVTAADSRMALRYSVGLENLIMLQRVLADIDADGDVDAADARLILNMSVGSRE